MEFSLAPMFFGRSLRIDSKLTKQTKQKLEILGLKPQNSTSFILGTLDWLGSAEPSMSWLVVEAGK